MHLGTPSLLTFFDAHRNDKYLVLATIIATVGSTYRKPGAMMLIAADGSFEGLISGGCLEADLLCHAEDVFRSGAPQRVTYDMHADDDLVWSLGLGCDGVIHLQLQRLDRSDDFGFLGHLDRAHRARRSVLLALVTESDGRTATGSHALLDSTGDTAGAPVLLDLLREVAAAWPAWRFRNLRFGGGDAGECLAIHIPPTPRVLICGAGPDAVPLARLLTELTWDTIVVDHRPAYARPDRFPVGCEVLLSRPENLADTVDPTALDAAVIMSHHLENDRLYLSGLAPHNLAYLGVLGPRARRLKLSKEAGCAGRAVFGPVGLDIGAELPASIALAIAAEIHAVLNDRDGGMLTEIAT